MKPVVTSQKTPSRQATDPCRNPSNEAGEIIRSLRFPVQVALDGRHMKMARRRLNETDMSSFWNEQLICERRAIFTAPVSRTASRIGACHAMKKQQMRPS